MPEPKLQGLLAAARRRVGDAQAMLRQPRACDAGRLLTLLREALGYLEWARDTLGQGGPEEQETARQAAALAVEIHHAGVLLERARQQGRDWLDHLRCVAPEYTAAGEHVRLRSRGRVLFTG